MSIRLQWIFIDEHLKEWTTRNQTQDSNGKKIVGINIKYQNIMNIMNITSKPFQTPRSFTPVSLKHQTLIH